MLAVATGVGALVGTLVGERLPQAVLRRGFAVIVSAVAVGLLIDVLALGGPPADQGLGAGSGARCERSKRGRDGCAGCLDTRCTPHASDARNPSAISSTAP